MTHPKTAAYKGEVLVVDDNPTNLTLLCNMLSAEGYETRAALSGALALRAVNAEAPDLILLDVNMPGLNGYDVCRELKAQVETRNIPIVFISALDAIGDKVMAFEVGGADYVTKPFQMHEVLSRVATQITLVRLHRELAERDRELAERYRQIEELRAMVHGSPAPEPLPSTAPSPQGASKQRPPSRSTLAILATNIQDFVRLSEETAPDRLMADLDVYLATLATTVTAGGGEVDMLLGDGMVAFFTDVARALRAACNIQKSVAEFNEGRAAAGRRAFATRVGVATGPAILARAGNGRHVTIIGECVSLASRLQADARAGGVLMDNATFEAAGRPAEARHIVMRVRGKAELIKAHELAPDVAPRLYATPVAEPVA